MRIIRRRRIVVIIIVMIMERENIKAAAKVAPANKKLAMFDSGENMLIIMMIA